jgi:hypothetical protein
MTHPTLTYADDPARFVESEAAQQAFETNVGAYPGRLWRQVEVVAGAPWFSALDIYIAVMTRWRPRRGWFEAQCPRLYGPKDTGGMPPPPRITRKSPTGQRRRRRGTCSEY